METAVQVIESIFYIWLALHFHQSSDITHKRYYDWFLTTPTMLISLCLYLNYLKEGSNKEKKETLFEKCVKQSTVLIPILGLNAAMIISGFLGETHVIPMFTSVAIGMVPFVAYFYMIYQEYAKYTDQGRIIFWVFSGIWALYAVAALMPYYWKNITYNMLDLVAKNFFGLFLAYVIWIET